MTSFSKPTVDSPDAFSSVRTISTPAGAPYPGQPVYNTQRGSSMPADRYRGFADEVPSRIGAGPIASTAPGPTRSSAEHRCGARSTSATATRR